MSFTAAVLLWLFYPLVEKYQKFNGFYLFSTGNRSKTMAFLFLFTVFICTNRYSIKKRRKSHALPGLIPIIFIRIQRPRWKH